MRDPQRISKLLARLRVAWEKNPDQRLGQLYANLIGVHIDFFNVEDEVLAEALDQYERTGKLPRLLNKERPPLG